MNFHINKCGNGYMIKYAFIDIDDTLLDFDKNAILAVKKAFGRVGLNFKVLH